MTLTGRKRTYFSQPLDFGKRYAYSIDVETTRDGRVIKASRYQKLSAGDVVQLEAVFKDRSDVLLLRRVSGSVAEMQLHVSQ
jgi:hypothetical protein